MEAPSLRDIELALTTLWTRRAQRESFLAGSASQAGIHPALVKHIDVRGVKLYASLIEHGRLDLMASIYPHCKKILGKHFTSTVHDYMETMPPEHFNLNQAARKFAQFLAVHESTQALRQKHAFLAELADYEWIELEVMESNVEVHAPAVQENLQTKADSEAKLEQDLDLHAFATSVPQLNPTLIARAYKYPISEIVSKIEHDEKLPRRQKAEASWVLALRAADHEARYVDISELAYILVQAIIANSSITYGELIALACSHSSDSAEETVADFLTMVEDFKEIAVIL